ncbi:ferrous iron transport protein B [Cellulomonas flavigena DSM 20109]|uniref:Ferrous iron transport protein B n=1 Tax=Cellulomonas flavigena (strain ATCC 482 / DSM 20109 / BCRC 11376 / JCM 18109 / NBRC 3775 / NCIMB 8073 / NRS 134) TaxID=446466 RepID=D5UIL2_CELFN|nr:ferrous iron transporter B [Cellulomonas flavigena]ADG73511.1 ferrous iron transport protein B [Cellulomonas flavigena DSM 20109]
MSCHEPAGAGTTTTGAPLVVLVGNPNVGKSTLFNALTGGRQRVVNAPGTTVELQTGTWRLRDDGTSHVRLVDLPGTYSLLARSPDEQVTADAVAGRTHAGAADLAVVLVEAGALPRSLYLLAQVARAGLPVVVALTMTDVARARGVHVDAAALADRLGVPVVPLHPRDGRGAGDLAQAVVTTLRGGRAEPTVPPAADDAVDDADVLFAWVDATVRAVGGVAPAGVRTWSDRADRLLLHPVLGVPVLLLVTWLLFQLATAAAAPLMEAVDGFVTGTLADALAAALAGLHAPAWLHGLLVDGVLAGVGTVATFAPLMALMFVAVALLEDCGYLARAAFVADRAMRALGLDGRALLPFVVGFGCNVPALAAARTLPHARQRLLVGLLVPWTSCPARLTVYVLLASVFFPAHAGTAIFLMYVASVGLVVGGGLLLRATLFRDLRREPLVLALPAYQRPRLRALAVATWVRVRSFLTKAGQVIVVTLTVVWVALAVPVTGGHAVGDVPVEDSLYGRAAQAVAPVLAPAGFGDWHASAALVTGFVAKEVVVGALAQVYAVDEPDDPAAAGDLGERLRATFTRSSGGHPQAAAAAFMVFVLAYTPCLATVAEQRRLLGARWTVGCVGGQLVVAWLLAVLVFRVGVWL